MEYNEIDKLRKFKEKSGWSYLKVANLMGVAIQSIINWLNGTYKPSNMAKEKIRKFLADYSYKG